MTTNKEFREKKLILARGQNKFQQRNRQDLKLQVAIWQSQQFVQRKLSEILLSEMLRRMKQVNSGLVFNRD